MQLPPLTLTVEIDPVVKIICLAFTCRHNLVHMHASMCCNLKHIEVMSDGRCGMYELKPEKQGDPHV